MLPLPLVAVVHSPLPPTLTARAAPLATATVPELGIAPVFANCGVPLLMFVPPL